MYNHKEIEKKWQKYWEENKTFKVKNDFSKTKYYALDMFPYPSGEGLHVGHPEGYTANDIVARYKNAKGFNVLHPMGWDAFGLPAENYAIKTGTHPRITTDKNINTFRKQVKALGFSYDWDREVDTTDPEYYKWTQWIFLKLFEKGLAYEQDLPINYCPSCKTGLANEEVLNDFSCDRCGTKVEKKKLRQWVLAITKYAERLLNDVDKLDWPEGIKDMQRNWIGKSEGCEFEMKKSDDETKSISVYTTRIDTVFGMTYAVLAPDHSSVNDFITEKQKSDCEAYIENTNKMSDQDRTADNKEKTGVFTGSYVVNPFNGKEVPLWIGDYVLGNYGTGAVMAVPSHDTRDFEFAKKYDLDIEQSIAKYILATGVNAPKKGKEDKKREFINAIIEYNGKFLLLKEKVGCKFVGGGLENNESTLDGIKREILEETGFTDFGKINTVLNSAYYGYAYRHTHDRNDKGFDYPFFHIKLNSLKQEEISEKEKAIHDLIWVEKNEVKGLLFSDGHKYPWECFLKEKAFTELGILVNSGEFTGLSSKEAKTKLAKFAEEKGFGTKKLNYKLRDWLFSRQRYRGEPIPLIHLEKDDYKDLIKIEYKENIPYVKLTGLSTPRSNESIINFDCVTAIIKHPTEDRYLALETVNGEYVLVGGKLEEYENMNEAVIREVKEETGFQNIEIKDVVFEKIYSRGYKARKDREEQALDKVYYIELKDLEQDKHIAEQEGLKQSNWFSFEEITTKLITHHKFFVQNYFTRIGKANFAYISKKGCEEKLIINNGNFSKIYEGLDTKIVCDYNLPLKLPKVNEYEPAGDGQSPLAVVDDFVNIKIADNLIGKRETNTMPQWGGSCWYYLRYMDPDNKDMLVDPEAEKYWGQVDSYVGGAEHAVLHLLYARFWHKFLFDIGVVSSEEPFYRLRNQGLIQAFAYKRRNGGLVANDLVEEKDGKYFEISSGEELDKIVAKMSKSLKNVVNPDEIIEEFGADSLRLYEMYMAEFKDSAPWDSKGIIGVRRFLEKVERAFISIEAKIAEDDNQAIKLLHKTIKKVEEDIENYKFNTAIASMMILVNYGKPKDKELFEEWKYDFIKILSPFAPHIAEELFEKCSKHGGKGKSVFYLDWPEYDENLIVDDSIKIGVQVLGKLRGEIEISKDEEKESVLEKAKNNEDVKKWLEGKNIVKEIYVPGKIVNLVVK